MIRVFYLFMIFLSSPCFAHKLAPSLLEVVGQDSQHFTILWKTPALSGSRSPEPALPASCLAITEPRQYAVGTSIEWHWQVQCPQGLEGQDIQVTGLIASRTAALIKISLFDGRQYSQLIRRDSQVFTVPLVPDIFQVVKQYFVLGVEHILIGFDHLLFVTGLLLLAASWRQLLLTVTAFTVGHSVTLVLLSVGVVPKLGAWVELAIAATILYLAIELSAKSTGSGRLRWPLITAFGLIHGLGFASVLNELGLPQGDVIAGLVSFNVGIEVGQLVFISALGMAFMLLRKLADGAAPLMRSAAIYTMGGMAVFWCLDRSYGLIVDSLYYL